MFPFTQGAYGTRSTFVMCQATRLLARYVSYSVGRVPAIRQFSYLPLFPLSVLYSIKGRVVLEVRENVGYILTIPLLFTHVTRAILGN